MSRKQLARARDRTSSRSLPWSAAPAQDVPRQTSRSADQSLGQQMADQLGFVTVSRALPACAIMIDAQRRVRRDSLQSRGIPMLPASDAPPVAARLERAPGQRRGRVTHRACRRSEVVLMIVEQPCCCVWSRRARSHGVDSPAREGTDRAVAAARFSRAK